MAMQTDTLFVDGSFIGKDSSFCHDAGIINVAVFQQLFQAGVQPFGICLHTPGAVLLDLSNQRFNRCQAVQHIGAQLLTLHGTHGNKRGNRLLGNLLHISPQGIRVCGRSGLGQHIWETADGADGNIVFQVQLFRHCLHGGLVAFG